MICLSLRENVYHLPEICGHIIWSAPARKYIWLEKKNTFLYSIIGNISLLSKVHVETESTMLTCINK